MSEGTLGHIVYSKNVIEFVTVANEYCNMMEGKGNEPLSVMLGRLQKILPLVYLKASMLPKVEPVLDEELEKFVSELDYNMLLQKWMKLLGEHDAFKEVFAAGMEFSEEAIENTISENLMDIYQDLKEFITSFSLGNEEVMNDSLSECILSFEQYWGQNLVNVLRPIHALLVSGKDLDEVSEEDRSSSEESANSETDWVDGFFDQFRDGEI